MQLGISRESCSDDKKCTKKLDARAKRLACFETTKAAKFLKKFQVILYSMVKESMFLNEKLCIIGV